MYLDTLVEIPDKKGKITIYSKGKSSYVNYEVDRVYDPKRKFNIPKRVTIGKLSNEDHGKMIPNHNFLHYFPEIDVSKKKIDIVHSSCLRVGTYLVIEKVLKEYELPEMLSQYFDEEELGLFLDLIACTLTCESNVWIYYPLYAYEHPLFTKDMQIYESVQVKEFLSDETVKGKMDVLAPIIKNAIYMKLEDTLKSTNATLNSMTIIEVIRELEKVEMIRGCDQIYRLDHVLTPLQESIFKTFEMDSESVMVSMNHISNQLTPEMYVFHREANDKVCCF